MTNSREKAIRLTIITAVVSLLLSAVCCAAFVINLSGLMKPTEPAPADAGYSVSVVYCAGDAEVCEFTAVR